jgi:ubiquinone biosynthesis protein Coq4
MSKYFNEEIIQKMLPLNREERINKDEKMLITLELIQLAQQLDDDVEDFVADTIIFEELSPMEDREVSISFDEDHIYLSAHEHRNVHWLLFEHILRYHIYTEDSYLEGYPILSENSEIVESFRAEWGDHYDF